MTAPSLLPQISKVLNATFLIGGTAPDYADAIDFACDVKALKVSPDSSKDGDDVTLACGTVLPAPRKDTFTVNGTAIQRFNESTALQAYSHAHNGETVHFAITFNDTEGTPTYSGTIVMEKLEVGGDAGSDPGDLAFEFDGVDDFDTVYPPAAPLAAEADDDAEAVAA